MEVVKGSVRKIGQILSGQWMFWWGSPNGETVIFWRSVQITVLLYLVGQGVRSAFDAKCSTGCHLDIGGLWQDGTATATWVGAIFAAAWSSLFARFVADRNYLAGALNQMRTAQATGKIEDYKFLHLWQAGFIAEAYDLHLATSPVAGPVIYRLLTRPDCAPVREQVDSSTHLGTGDRQQLLEWLKAKGFGGAV